MPLPVVNYIKNERVTSVIIRWLFYLKSRFTKLFKIFFLGGGRKAISTNDFNLLSNILSAYRTSVHIFKTFPNPICGPYILYINTI